MPLCPAGIHERPAKRKLRLRCPDCTATADRAAVLAAINRADDSLARSRVEQAIDRHLAKGVVARRIASYLEATPDALTSGDPRSPWALQQLVAELVDAGALGLRKPACPGCGRVIELRLPAPGGRICQACWARTRIGTCHLCGRQVRVVRSKTDGLLRCSRCRRRDRSKWELCGRCAQFRPVGSRRDGVARCEVCTQVERPLEVCAECGEERIIKYRPHGRPTCVRCYRAPVGLCGHCNQLAPIAIRARGSWPAFCVRCYQPVRRCRTCRGGYCQRRRKYDVLEFVGKRRRPIRPLEECARCGEHEPVQARWPDGPVCSRCYDAGLIAKAPCEQCGQLRRPWPTNGRTLCSHCAGLPQVHTCSECGDETKLYAKGKCARCVLRERLIQAASAGRGVVRPELMPAYEALANIEDPKVGLRWLNKSDGYWILYSLGDKEGPVTHDTFDSVSRRRLPAVQFVRQMLVSVGVLAPRDEQLVGFEDWLRRWIDYLSPEEQRVIRPFGEWQILRGLRRRSQQRELTPGAVKFAKSRIMSAIGFVRWLQDRDQTLETARQEDVDAWLSSHRTPAYNVRAFLRWTAERGLTEKLSVPLRPVLSAKHAVSVSGHTSLTRDILRGPERDAARLAGALVLLYSQPASRICRLRVDSLSETDAGLAIRLHREDVVLPEPIAELARRVLAMRRGHVRIGQTGTSVWLFPGGLPSRPISEDRMGRWLHQLGVEDVRRARSTAAEQLAAQVPAKVLADLIGVHIVTAIEWVRVAAGHHSAYAAVARQRSRGRRV